MSGVSTIRNAIATTISTALPTVNVAASIGAINQLPAILVAPVTSDYELTFNAGTDEWMFDIFIVCSRADDATGQAALDGFISGAGANSIRAILRANQSVGLPDTTVVPVSMRGYGGRFKEAAIQMVGAVITVRAYTDGTV